MPNALIVDQACLRGLVVRRHDGLFSYWLSIKEMCNGATQREKITVLINKW
jgi:hypothetical protein